MPDDYLDQLRPEDRAKKYNFGNVDPLRPYTIVATESGHILGFATTAPTEGSAMSDYGELCALYVDPDHWDRGIGAAVHGFAQRVIAPSRASACHCRGCGTRFPLRTSDAYGIESSALSG